MENYLKIYLAEHLSVVTILKTRALQFEALCLHCSKPLTWSQQSAGARTISPVFQLKELGTEVRPLSGLCREEVEPPWGLKPGGVAPERTLRDTRDCVWPTIQLVQKPGDMVTVEAPVPAAQILVPGQPSVRSR